VRSYAVDRYGSPSISFSLIPYFIVIYYIAWQTSFLDQMDRVLFSDLNFTALNFDSHATHRHLPQKGSKQMAKSLAIGRDGIRFSGI